VEAGVDVIVVDTATGMPRRCSTASSVVNENYPQMQVVAATSPRATRRGPSSTMAPTA